MSKVILFVQVSLDGFFEGPKKEIGWHMVDDELFAHVIAELKRREPSWTDGSPTTSWRRILADRRRRPRELCAFDSLS